MLKKDEGILYSILLYGKGFFYFSTTYKKPNWAENWWILFWWVYKD